MHGEILDLISPDWLSVVNAACKVQLLARPDMPHVSRGLSTWVILARDSSQRMLGCHGMSVLATRAVIVAKPSP